MPASPAPCPAAARAAHRATAAVSAKAHGGHVSVQAPGPPRRDSHCIVKLSMLVDDADASSTSTLSRCSYWFFQSTGHSHSIVNSQGRLIGRSGALTGRSERDTDSRTVASLAIIEVPSRRSLPACRSGRRTWDRLGSKLTTLTVSIGRFSDAVTVLAGPMTVSRLRLPAPRNGRARVSGSRLRAGAERPTRQGWCRPRSRTAPGSQIVRKE